MAKNLDKVADYITLIHEGRIIESMRLDQIGLLTFTIWGDNHAKSHSIIESL